MDAPDTQGSVTVARWAIAGAALLVGLGLAVMTAAGFAYSQPQGPERLQELAGPLVVSVALGIATVAAVQATLRRPIASPLLGLGVLPAGLFALQHLGVIGG